jgi:hypothetical protein
MYVITVDTAVFCNLLCGGGVDDAPMGLSNDIRDSGVFEWITKAKGCELPTRKELYDLRGNAIVIEIFNCSSSLGLVGKKNKSNAVRLILVSMSVPILKIIHFEAVTE